jgi:trehalose-6-phosphatase
MRVNALFSDYDGTLASEDVRAEESRVAPELDGLLKEVSGQVPFALITSKDCAFIRPRTPYAAAWSCVSGLETVYAYGGPRTANSSRDLRGDAEWARRELPGTRIEEKTNGEGTVLGFSVDWRGAAMPDGLETALERMRSRGLSVQFDPQRPFADVFAEPPDTGAALRTLRDALAPGGTTMYLGDSRFDNAAFRECDIAVGVSHGQELSDLACEFWVEQQDLSLLLGALRSRGYEFDRSLPSLHSVRR